MRLWAATGDAIVRVDGRSVTSTLEGSGAHCLAVAAPDTVYAGLLKSGVRKTVDGGESWRDVSPPDRAVFSLAVSPVDGAVYAGTEPSRLFRSDDGGESWRPLDALLELPSRPTWSFPPRPWTSHVRWIAPSRVDAGLLLVGIELGGLMRSADGGRTWADHAPGAQRDVHSLLWHRAGRAYEAAGGGAAWSDDAGMTWSAADDGRDRHYTWAVAADPGDPATWLVSASTGPYAAHGGGPPQARIFRRRGDTPWESVTDELPAMAYALTWRERLYAGLADGAILASDDAGDSWEPLPARLPAIRALEAV
jgi:photosystem II stability/assembly factor-like uncharacterized protein